MSVMDDDSPATEQAATASNGQSEQSHGSDGLRALGRKYAKQAGFQPLKPGERLSPSWYFSNTSGKPAVPINEGRRKVS